MKRFIAALMCIIMVFTLTACGTENDSNSLISAESVSTIPENHISINEYGIDISAQEFRTAFNSAASGKYSIGNYNDEKSENVQADIDIGIGNPSDNWISVTSENDKLVRLSVSCICSDDEKEQYTEVLSDVFAIIWNIFYPNTQKEALDSLIKECRYSGENIFSNDLYVRYGDNTAFGSDNRIITWTITSIEKYKTNGN